MKNLNYKLLNNQYTNLSNIRNILEITIIIVPYFNARALASAYNTIIDHYIIIRQSMDIYTKTYIYL